MFMSMFTTVEDYIFTEADLTFLLTKCSERLRWPPTSISGVSRKNGLRLYAACLITIYYKLHCKDREETASDLLEQWITQNEQIFTACRASSLEACISLLKIGNYILKTPLFKIGDVLLVLDEEREGLQYYSLRGSGVLSTLVTVLGESYDMIIAEVLEPTGQGIMIEEVDRTNEHISRFYSMALEYAKRAERVDAQLDYIAKTSTETHETVLKLKEEQLEVARQHVCTTDYTGAVAEAVEESISELRQDYDELRDMVEKSLVAECVEKVETAVYFDKVVYSLEDRIRRLSSQLDVALSRIEEVVKQSALKEENEDEEDLYGEFPSDEILDYVPTEEKE